ncbi:MAG: thiamine phosphate synthase [Azoarcus sp.]|jgi:thiamine-phosphate pyrophosphorylase|nr:thiamine phosphate synthase [Azoarcus sp.]
MKTPWRGCYAITPDEADTGRLMDQVVAVLAGHPALLQYRNKQAGPALRREQARKLLPLCRAVGVPFVINDDLALALDLGADGVHLGHDDGDPATARRALGTDRILGVSCYDEWRRAATATAAGADYIAFGAMFASTTKPRARHAPFDLLARARRELDVTVAAIGGITLANAADVIAAGADLVAVISDLFNAPDPGARAAAFAELFTRVPRSG